MDLVDSCRKYSKRISSAVPAIFCDICKKWVHLKCSNLSVSQFAALSSSSTLYFCHMCISDSLPVNLDCDHSISDITYNSLPLISDPSDSECKYYDLHVFNSLLSNKTIAPVCIVHVIIKKLLKKNSDELVNFISEMKKSAEIIAVCEEKKKNIPLSFKPKYADIILYMFILPKKLVVLEYI